MYLKTLTLRGFKSFASATTLNFEPGITCVVGPNGSGKSNVVDALAWVMGEQGAKSLRGGNMADVIFAGTSSRAPLGRAEVSLTIDNSDGVLPIDYTEVTISRTLFRNGGSEYAINGTPCRLLDIQELLSDTGMGREMHVIVGQGQLDSVLSATPEDRRAFVEEAAGVLKHRRRKEKALRKLDSMEANVARLKDLVGEIRRQLGPLARQAEVARKASVVQADARDAKARLLADDLVQMLANLEAEKADEQALRTQRSQVEKEVNETRARVAELEQQAARQAPLVNEASEYWYRLSSVRERLRGTLTLAEERIRLLDAPDQAAASGPDPDELERQADQARSAQQELEQEKSQAGATLDDLIVQRKQAEERAAQAERHLSQLHQQVADHREGVAKLTGQVSAKRSRVEATEAEIERLRNTHTNALKRARAAEEEYLRLEHDVVGAQTNEEEVKAAHNKALTALDAHEKTVAELTEKQQEAHTTLASYQARAEALELALTKKDANNLLREQGHPGVIGPLAEHISVQGGYEDAIAAALGNWADALVMDSIDSTAQALAHSRTTQAGVASLIVAAEGEDDDAVSAPPVGVWAREMVRLAPPARAISRLLDGVVVVESLEEAPLAVSHGLTAVTIDGDLVSPTHARGGDAGGPSTLQLHAAREETQAAIHKAQQDLNSLEEAISPAREALQRAQGDVEEAANALNESGARRAEVSEKLAVLRTEVRSANSEAKRAQTAIEQAQANWEVIRDELAVLVQRLEGAQQPPTSEGDMETARAQRDSSAAQASQVRGAETDARLKVRTLEERINAISGRVQSLQQAAVNERRARQQAQERAEKRAEQARRATQVAHAVQQVLAALEKSLTAAQQLRQDRENHRTHLNQQLALARAGLDELNARHAELTDVVHKDEVARASYQAKIEQLEQKSVEALGMQPQDLIEHYGPENPVPVVEEDHTRHVPYVREEQEKRLRKAERSLAVLGKVNPLALEEHKALEERHQFLSDQLADIEKTRSELLGIIRDIDHRVENVFADAFADTAREFETVFGELFPGGEGKLTLTDPQDMLTTGIDVEARPPGKKVKRLSLLSGGERSLTAVALLLAIFKARPSPFYVMDEVEAALDDANLGRLLEQFNQLREKSQLIIITHQKRTMEIADALYGVTMRDDGVTTVISQRMAESHA